MTPTVGSAATVATLGFWCDVGLAVVELAGHAVFDQRQVVVLAAKLGVAVGVAHGRRRRGNLVERDFFAGDRQQPRFAGIEADDHSLPAELAGKGILHRVLLFLGGLVLA